MFNQLGHGQFRIYHTNQWSYCSSIRRQDENPIESDEIAHISQDALKRLLTDNY